MGAACVFEGLRNIPINSRLERLNELDIPMWVRGRGGSDNEGLSSEGGHKEKLRGQLPREPRGTEGETPPAPLSRPAPLPTTRNLFLNSSSNTRGGKANKPDTKIFLRRR